MACVWVLVKDHNGLIMGNAVKVRPVPEDVADLRKAVKVEKANALKNWDADELVVYRNAEAYGALEHETKMSSPVRTDSTEEDAYIVVAPAKTNRRPRGSPTDEDMQEHQLAPVRLLEGYEKGAQGRCSMGCGKYTSVHCASCSDVQANRLHRLCNPATGRDCYFRHINTVSPAARQMSHDVVPESLEF